MDEFDAFKKTIDVYAKSDLLDVIELMMERLNTHGGIPKNIQGYDLLCYAYNKSKKYLKAVEYGELAVAAAQNIEQRTAVLTNLGKIYLSANLPLKSKSAYEQVMDVMGEEPNLLIDYAAALFACGEKQKSRDIMMAIEKDAWKYSPVVADSIMFNLGVHYMQEGDFRKGMEHLYVGRKLNVFGSYSRVWDIPEWDGKPKNGLRLLMVGEGGIGDEIINVRFVKHLKDMGIDCSLMTVHGLDSIYSHLGFTRICNDKTYKAKDYDAWTPIMALPKTLSLDYPDLWYGSYLRAKPEYISKFDTTFNKNRFNVALRWAGNPRYDHELHRTISLERMVETIGKRDWALNSIQRDVGMEQLAAFRNRVVDLSPYLETFDDLLGALTHVDLVITSCTSVVHAAAALGKRVIVMVPIMEYYIWAENKIHSSWYGDRVSIVRQTVPGSWDEPFAQLAEILDTIEQ